MNFRYKNKRHGKTISINSTLSLIFEEYGLIDSFIIENIRLKWQRIVGELMASHSLPDRIFKNILFIAVDHPVYSTELSFMKEIIVKEINNEFDNTVIKDIRLETKKLDWKRLNPKNA